MTRRMPIGSSSRRRRLLVVVMAVVVLVLTLHHLWPCFTHGFEQSHDLCPLCTLMASLVLAVAGLVLFGSIPQDSFPDVSPVEPAPDPASWAVWSHRGPPFNLLLQS